MRLKDDLEYSARIFPLLGQQSDASIKRDIPGSYSPWQIGVYRRELGINKWHSVLTVEERRERERTSKEEKKALARALPDLLRRFGGGKLMDAEMKAFLLKKDMTELEKKYG